MVATIIVAAGSGQRMGGEVPKQFLEIGGEVVLMRTIRNFSYLRGTIVVVLSADWIDYWQKLCVAKGFEVAHTIVSGGAERSDSVRRGLAQVEGAEVALVQDGVRPLASHQLIDRVVAAAREHGAAVPVVEVTDTIRSTTGGVVDRSALRAVQTPQGFRFDILQQAYAQAGAAILTDDAQVVEASGTLITLVAGERTNIKITTPFDLKIAETIW